MYTIAEIKTDRTVKLNEHLQSYPTKLVPKPFDYGVFSSRIDAIRRLVLTFYPELINSSDVHIKRVSKEFLRGSHSHFKIVKI